MARLKNRQMQIPGGMKFYQPETKWQPPPFSSFQVIVDNLINHRRANPAILSKYPVDQPSVENEVDAFNARLCQQMGWNDFITSPLAPTPPPFSRAPSQSDQSKLSAVAGAVKKIWAGIKTVNEWLDSEEPAVSAELSTARAAVCAACPKNSPGDFTKWFTKPASEGIRRQLEKAEKRKLSTPYDEKLNICDVCLCPMKLKVHCPPQYIKANLSEDVLAELRSAPNCWIPKELNV